MCIILDDGYYTTPGAFGEGHFRTINRTYTRTKSVQSTKRFQKTKLKEDLMLLRHKRERLGQGCWPSQAVLR
jgi:hypothetical protein